MENPQINITLGTAGHIDHGKTELIKLLTGCDTDHLKIEKERGMSIELGFAPCVIRNMEIGIVDVPGHEHFIKTMVAGATGIDGVIFVIAADDGVMPQTREHLDILTLLGVRHGLVVLTKIDIVDGPHQSSVTKDIQNFLKGTFLEDKPICPLSSVTGEGFDDFYEALKQVVAQIQPKTTKGIFRLPVEKTFSFAGFGTVVTGIPVAGRIHTADEVILLAAGQKGRVKSIQVYNRTENTAMSGQCAALNVPQWDYKTIKRGDTVTIDGYFEPCQWYLGCLDILDSASRVLKNAATVKLHTSTSEVNAKVYLLQDPQLDPGIQKRLVQVWLEAPIVAGPGDRFIIRMPSPADTIGGGFLIEAVEKRVKRSDSEKMADIHHRSEVVNHPVAFAEYAIQTAPAGAATASQVAYRIKQDVDQVNVILQSLIEGHKIARLSKNLYIHNAILKQIQETLCERVKAFHEKHPQRIGIPVLDLHQQSGLDKTLYDHLTAYLIDRNLLCQKDGLVSLAGHQTAFNPQQQKLLDEIENEYVKALFKPPSPKQVQQKINLKDQLFDQAMDILTEQKILIEVEKGMFFHARAIEKAKNMLMDYFKEHPQLESVKFKYLVDTSRKYALPLLDYMDKIGVTHRVGNTRFPRLS